MEFWQSRNNQIVTEPFDNKAIEAKINHGFASIKSKSTLKGLKVLIGNHNIPAGATVYLPAEACRQAFAEKVYETEGVLDGRKFIVIPENFVLFSSVEYSLHPQTLTQS